MSYTETVDCLSLAFYSVGPKASSPNCAYTFNVIGLYTTASEFVLDRTPRLLLSVLLYHT